MKSDLSYIAAMHGVQSAIATEIITLGEDEAGASPKHLRVGVNSAMVNDLAVAELLIEKGIFTREEYIEAVRKAANRELDEMTDRVRNKLDNQRLSFG